MSSSAWQRVDDPRPMPSRVLVLGSTGMVGRSWTDLLGSKNIKHAALHRPDFDLAVPASIERALQDEYDLVINAAAWTDVDGAESDPSGCDQANAHAVAQIARRCDEMGALLITYSTDYVFSGDALKPYPIDAPIEPRNAYGRSKALGESMLREITDRHLLIRTSWVYAPWGTNFVRTMRLLLQQRPVLKVVNDQQGRPSSAQQLARASLELYLNGASGTWHLTDAGECTWFEFANHIARSIGSSCHIDPCASSAFPRPAKRPHYSTLETEPTDALIGPQAHWTTRVDAVLGAQDTMST